MPVLMLMLITLLNDGTMIAVGYDRVTPQQMPEKWNKPALFLLSSVLAAVALISSLLLLWLLLDRFLQTKQKLMPFLKILVRNRYLRSLGSMESQQSKNMNTTHEALN